MALNTKRARLHVGPGEMTTVRMAVYAIDDVKKQHPLFTVEARFHDVVKGVTIDSLDVHYRGGTAPPVHPARISRATSCGSGDGPRGKK